MKTITKGLVGTVAAGAMALSSASPAFARDHDGRNHDGVSTGEVIAGALIIGGIAAIAAAASDNDRGRGEYRDYDYGRGGYRDDDRGYGNGYGYNGGNGRDAVERCVATAESQAARYSYGRADVTDIRSVDRSRNGFTVKGRIAVNSRGHAWRQGDRRYGDGWGNDYRGWNSNLRGYDSGKFTCTVRNGRVVDIDFSGIRGLR
jgi:hypothetical protein